MTFAYGHLRLATPTPGRGRPRKLSPPPEPPKLALETAPPPPVRTPEGKDVPTGSTVLGYGGPTYQTSTSFVEHQVWYDPEGRAVNLPEDPKAYRVPGVGWIRFRPVHRKDVDHIRESPQPVPTDADVSRYDTTAMIWRNWPEDPRPACRLCRECIAYRNRDNNGVWRCHAAVPFDFDDAGAALYEQPD